MDRDRYQSQDQRFPTNDDTYEQAPSGQNQNQNQPGGDYEQRYGRDERQEGSEMEGSLSVPTQPRQRIDSVSPSLPSLGIGKDEGLDFADFDAFASILGSGLSDGPREEVEKVQKRASNVLKLAQENDKLQKELKEMADRLEAAERKKEELERRERGGQHS